jgi:hypothetical protein
MDEATRAYYGFSAGPKVKKPKAKKLPAIVKEIKKYTLQSMDYSKQKSISYSQMSMFTHCPHKWSLQYKDGNYTSESSINMTFGTALHEALQHYITVIYDKSGAEADRIELNEYFEERLRETYKKDVKSNNNVHFSNSFELAEFYEDGVEILNYIKKNRNILFSKKGWYLVGCEVPILINPNQDYPNILFKGYLDVVLYNELTDKFLILDIKTSKTGWNSDSKKDETKQFQLILYKYFFSKQFNVLIDNIDIKFFIVKRKINEDAEFAAAKKRVQEFVPANGKVKINKATQAMNKFIETCFDQNGVYRQISHEAIPSLWNCRFCPFSGKPELCSKGLK